MRANDPLRWCKTPRKRVLVEIITVNSIALLIANCFKLLNPFILPLYIAHQLPNTTRVVKHLVVIGATLPEVTLRSRSRPIRIPRIRNLRVPRGLLVASGREAGEEHDEGAQEQTAHGGDLGPDGGGELGVAAGGVFLVVVDVVADGAGPGQVGGHDDDGQDPGDGRDEGGEEGAADAGAEREEEGDEGEARDDGVQDHDAG